VTGGRCPDCWRGWVELTQRRGATACLWCAQGRDHLARRPDLLSGYAASDVDGLPANVQRRIRPVDNTTKEES
jgi:hypothetical protein